MAFISEEDALVFFFYRPRNAMLDVGRDELCIQRFWHRDDTRIQQQHDGRLRTRMKGNSERSSL